MFLITKVNVPIELWLFWGILKPLEARRIKKYIEVTSFQKMSATMVA